MNTGPISTDTSSIAVLGIAAVASMALLEQMVIAGGTLDGIKSAVRHSAYWPEFCRLASAGEVPAGWVREPLATAVTGWAKADA